ncbi:MAG TPA: rhomboid family intramembrane serine protease [Bacteroidales bacterium]|nr:rhomboid family intramembrane serine protease [Bacteroidales bacterium]
MSGYSRGFFGMPPVVKNIIYINIIMLLALFAARSVFQVDLDRILGVYFFKSDKFEPYQLITHMFMHGNILHLFFNMFAFYMFGQILEQVWGPKRFLIYYLVTGLGAIIIHESVLAIQYYKVMSSITPDLLQDVLDNGLRYTLENKAYIDPAAGQLQSILYTPTVGASGAVFGILLAFGVLFPNTELVLIFPPIPIKAKYFVAGYAAIELYFAVTQPGDSIAHAAHIGGMIFGYLLIRYWRKTSNTLY